MLGFKEMLDNVNPMISQSLTMSGSVLMLEKAAEGQQRLLFEREKFYTEQEEKKTALYKKQLDAIDFW